MSFRFLGKIFLIGFALLCLWPQKQEAQAQGIFAPKAFYWCYISGDPVDFGLIDDSGLNQKVLTTTIYANCGRKWWAPIQFPIFSAPYCIIIRGSGVGDVYSGTRVLLNERDKNAEIYFNFYDPNHNPNIPIGGDFIDTRYNFIYGMAEPSIWNNLTGDFRLAFPVKVVLNDSRAGGGDGSIQGGTYSNYFTAELRYGGLIVKFPWDSGVKTAQDCLDLPQKPERASFTVRATVKSSCAVRTDGNIDFGKNPNFKLAEGISAIGKVSAICSKGQTYQIGLGMGLHQSAAETGKRALERAGGAGKASDFVAYDLYQDSSHMLPWTDAWGTPATKKNVSAGTWQNYDVYAFVPPQATDKTAGTYQDTVLVTIRLDAS